MGAPRHVEPPVFSPEERDRVFDGRSPVRRFKAYARQAVQRTAVDGVRDTGSAHPTVHFRRSPEMLIAGIGIIMESVAAELAEITKAVQQGRDDLATLATEVRALSDTIEPALLAYIRRLRTARMTAASEMAECLKILREVRQFFLEKDYEVEMQRLARFVGLADDFARLRAAGVLPALADCALRLAVIDAPKDAA